MPDPTLYVVESARSEQERLVLAEKARTDTIAALVPLLQGEEVLAAIARCVFASRPREEQFADDALASCAQVADDITTAIIDALGAAALRDEQGRR